MTPITMRLKKRCTDDGLVEVEDNVPLGKEYVVDGDTARHSKMYNLKYGKYHYKDIVDDLQGKWLPLELLEPVAH